MLIVLAKSWYNCKKEEDEYQYVKHMEELRKLELDSDDALFIETSDGKWIELTVSEWGTFKPMDELPASVRAGLNKAMKKDKTNA